MSDGKAPKMDLIDLLKLMARRWWVTVPVLIATVAGGIVVGQHVRPEYKTSASVVLVPPTTEVAAPAPGASPRPGNPWLRVGTVEMAQAIQIVASSGRARAAVVAAGGEARYEVTVLTRSSILTIDVTGTGPDRARASAAAVTRLIGDEVANRQAAYQPRPGEQITTDVLDPGLDVRQSRSNVLRAQIVLLALGLLVATTVAVVADAIIRRMARRRVRSAGDALPPAGQVTTHRPAGVMSPPAPARPEPDDTAVLSGARQMDRDAG
ncbi:hypothetical protein [Plantactinospora sp. GCM10030261]|uniref:hypothetical protein n=1 Tax=Plantactinospora sp. GCM10030261 TaxID=3273420 RepID=UPI00361A00AC